MDAKRTTTFEPDYAVAPGETLREVMESLGMSQADLARRTELTNMTVGRILRGEQPITYGTANRLELATGVPARLWNNLEMQYQEQKSKVEELARLEADLEWLKSIPTKELAERGEIPNQSEGPEQLRAALAFYGVSSVQAWHEIWDRPKVAARRSACFDSRPGPASAWLRIGERKAQEVACEPYDRSRFQKALLAIRGLTREGPAVFEPRAKELCAAAGVALVLVKEMAKVPWNGATEWLSPTKEMILLSLRGKGEDKFWFSFFHEAGHVLLHGKKDLFINDDSVDSLEEREANEFAGKTLFPGTARERIAKARSATVLRQIADDIGVSPGIVAGQFQFLNKKWNYHKNLIRKLNLA
ncbi:MAG: ImmA/IrrE family metallo-endopeptidase [Lentisphaeria bacterium]|jgi:addiction module HigA family antidote|nr:ImmA/IrrE family metallo-endopeptidase [Lentisphaeria bacterium]